MPSDFAKKIIGLLTPSLGEFTALQKLSEACKMAGITTETIDASQKEIISENIRVVCQPLGEKVAKIIKESVMEIPV